MNALPCRLVRYRFSFRRKPSPSPDPLAIWQQSNDECGRQACGEDARRRGHHAAHRQQEICQVRSRVACHVYDFRSGVRPRQAPPSPCKGDFERPCGVFSQQKYSERPHTVIVKRIRENTNRPRFPPARTPGLSCKQGSHYLSDLRMVAR